MLAMAHFQIDTDRLHLLLGCLIWVIGVCIAILAVINFYQCRTTVNPHKSFNLSANAFENTAGICWVITIGGI